ncbi:MAG: IreB family regulatory phosphoprotein [Clostridia bacterium]|nr:IreB family regulatory phosphoprotein [Clostridia bacterium]
MQQYNETLKISKDKDNSQKVKEVMGVVYDALKQKGYNPLSQIVAYLMSGDPTYITGYNNARILISRLERDEIMEEFAKEYLKTL